MFDKAFYSLVRNGRLVREPLSSRLSIGCFGFSRYGLSDMRELIGRFVRRHAPRSGGFPPLSLLYLVSLPFLLFQPSRAEELRVISSPVLAQAYGTDSLLSFLYQCPHHSLKIPPKKRRRFSKSFRPLSHVSTASFCFVCRLSFLRERPCFTTWRQQLRRQLLLAVAVVPRL